MITRDQILSIGQFTKPHGVNGEISAQLSCELPVFGKFSCLICDIDGILTPFFVESQRSKSATSALLKIQGIDNEHEATLLVNKEIHVLKSEFDQLRADDTEADDGEYPVDYFIGFKALTVNEDGTEQEVGTIADVDDTTSNVLFVIDRGQGHTALVPAVDAYIDHIDPQAKTLALNIPPELLDFQ